MKLVIEREGGFSIVEDADAITEIDVESHAVALTIEVGGDKWTKKLPVTDHAEACRVSAAIAAKCGTLVEPLSEAPETGKASEWVAGEPPGDGRLYVAREGVSTLCVRWDGERWRMWTMIVELGDGVAHLPTPISNR